MKSTKYSKKSTKYFTNSVCSQPGYYKVNLHWNWNEVNQKLFSTSLQRVKDTQVGHTSKKWHLSIYLSIYYLGSSFEAWEWWGKLKHIDIYMGQVLTGCKLLIFENKCCFLHFRFRINLQKCKVSDVFQRNTNFREYKVTFFRCDEFFLTLCQHGQVQTSYLSFFLHRDFLHTDFSPHKLGNLSKTF